MYSAPYNLDEFDLDYEAVNKMIREESIKYVLLAPSDLIKPLDVEKSIRQIVFFCGMQVSFLD